ncbi:MAG: hypothetical protein ACOX20_01670 [Limnochordia bacterium]|jgi:hypothetical protein|nr:hypothetical protein [Bacillota bacterium]
MAVELSQRSKPHYDPDEARRKFEQLLAMDRNSSDFLALFEEVDRLITAGMEKGGSA